MLSGGVQVAYDLTAVDHSEVFPISLLAADVAPAFIALVDLKERYRIAMIGTSQEIVVAHASNSSLACHAAVLLVAPVSSEPLAAPLARYYATSRVAFSAMYATIAHPLTYGFMAYSVLFTQLVGGCASKVLTFNLVEVHVFGVSLSVSAGLSMLSIEHIASSTENVAYCV